MQVAEGVYRLGSPYVNFYAVEDGGRVTFVDGGLAGYWDQVPSFLSGLGRSEKDVAAIVLTHSHGDHTGCVGRLQKASGASVFIHEAERGAMTGAEKAALPSGAKGALLRPRGIKMIGHMMSNGGMKGATVATVETYREDDVIDVPGKLRVVFTPGHSPGHAALLLEQKNVLFTGDALVTRDLRGRTGPRLMDINVDHEGARRSLDRIADVQAELVLPGHGEPWRDGVADAVARARGA